MPHAAILVTGAFIVGVAAYTVYKEIIQPNIEQRRRDEEEEWNAQELNRAMRLSLLEHQHEEQRRADQERWEQANINSHYSTSSSARYDNDTSATMTMRRRRHADPFSDAHEMQEVASSSRLASSNLLFDAGPSSRLDTISYDPPVDARTSATTEHNNELLETARSLSLTEEEIAFVKNEDLLNSPRSSAGSHLETYSVIEPDSRPASRSTSRSHSPLIVDVSSSSATNLQNPSTTANQQDLTAAVLEQAEQERQQSASFRAASPTPTIRSYTGSTIQSDNSPSYVSASRAPSHASASASHIRPISPFSEFGVVSAHSSDEDNEVSRPGSALRGGGSDRDLQWSDIGEDSSDEDNDQEIKKRNQRHGQARMLLSGLNNVAGM